MGSGPRSTGVRTRRRCSRSTPSRRSTRHCGRCGSIPGRRRCITPKEASPVRWAVSTTPGPRDRGAAAMFAPDGKTIYALSNRGSETTRVWRFAGGQWTPLTAPEQQVETFALKPDGKMLAVVVDAGVSSRLQLIDAGGPSSQNAAGTPRRDLGAAVAPGAERSGLHPCRRPRVQRRVLDRRHPRPAGALDVQRDGRLESGDACPTPRSSAGKASTASTSPACSIVRRRASPVPGR